MEPQWCVLLKYGELALKGRNRRVFEKYLLRSVEHAVADARATVEVSQRSGVLVLTSSAPREELVELARRVIGISQIRPALRVAKSSDDAADAAVRVLRERFGERADGASFAFAIRARRRHKGFPQTSETLAARIGQRVRDELGWPVNLDHPDAEVAVEVDRHEIFVSAERHPGQGGLPVGSSGYAFALLSGGYDSPTAAYRAMRRGLRCDFVHFTGAPYTGPSSYYKAYALVRQLSRFQAPSKLFTVPVGRAQRALATAGAAELQIVAQRRLLVRVAEVLARQQGARALVSGDSLGQVSSQTLANLATVEQATSLPLLRPLLGWDKDEIMAEARRIGTGEISQLPDEDCCQLIMPPRVATSSRAEQFTRIERRLDFGELVEELAANAQVLQVPDGGTAAGGGDRRRADEPAVSAAEPTPGADRPGCALPESRG